MWGLRRQVNLLLDHGHPHAWHYPIGRVWDESNLVAQRFNNQEATKAILLEMAVSSVLSKEGGKEFDKMIKRMTGD